MTAFRIAGMAAQGYAVARRVYEEAGYALRFGLANLINVFNFPLYTIGGGVSTAWELFEPRMFATIEECSYVNRMSQLARVDTYERDKTHVCRARLGSDASLLGAAMLPFQTVEPGSQ